MRIQFRGHFSEQAYLLDLFQLIAPEPADPDDDKIVDDCIVVDAYLHAKPKGHYARFKGKNAFLVHLSDESLERGFSEAYSCFQGVFRNYWSRKMTHPNVMTLPLGYTNHVPHRETRPAEERSLLWSFMGAGLKSSRPDMLRALDKVGPNYVLLSDVAASRPGKYARGDYFECLSETVFSPCPMGNVNLECFRLYESLEMGCIPLIEKRPFLDYFSELFGKHPLPTFSSWQNASLFVRNFEASAMNALQQECKSWWNGYKAGLRDKIRQVVNAPERKATRFSEPPRWSPALELACHHSGAALVRRLAMQTKRALRGKRLRITHGR